MTHPDLIDALAGAFPPERLLTAPAAVLPFESDGLTAFRERPRAVVMAETRDEVATAVRLCAQHKTPYVARGSGTSLSGGAVPIAGGIVIALNRMNRILRLDPAQRLAVVEPGVVNAAVSRAAAPFGLYYAPDPSSQPVCTIGGNVAFNSGGAHCLKYGMTSNHVLGITVVTLDGEFEKLGGESLESVGPDLPGLFVGSEGLLGTAVEITVRLLPVPQKYWTLLAAYNRIEDAGHAVAAVVAAGILPGAMEIMDRLAIQAAEAAVHAGYPDANAILIVELEGETATIELEALRLRNIIEGSGAWDIRVARNSDERLLLWKGRKSAFSAVGRLSPDYIVQDGVVPRSKLGEALGEIARMSKERGIRVANVFHAGDGNLHPLILFNGREAGALERAEELAGQILRLCLRLGGSITGEHGVGLEKLAYMPDMFGPVDLEVMRRVRSCIDPLHLSNEGKKLAARQPDTAVASRGAHRLERSGIISRE